MLGLEIYAESPADNRLDIFTPHFSEQVEKRCRDVRYRDHFLAHPRILSIMYDFTASAVS